MSFISRYVVPQFPPYKGPSAVGSFELEIPVASLPAQPAPPAAAAITTIQFRVFYPAAASAAPPRPVYWLPEPHQRAYLSGYARFLGAGAALAELLS